jgi:O-methyltransferase domain/Dimerisation domain
MTPNHEVAMGGDAGSSAAAKAPSPEKIMQLITEGWASSILGAAARLGLFSVLEGAPENAENLARKMGVSLRGVQALLDGLTGLGLLSLSNGRYENSREASAFLVRGKPACCGAMADVMMGDLETLQKLPESVKTGLPCATNQADVADNRFWAELVPAIASQSFPIAQIAAQRLGIAVASTVSWLDVGGGSGIFSAVWLGANPLARAFQLDWPSVNKVARGFVATFGVADRFETIDGDFHTTDFGAAKYDFAIYSHIAHQETPESNIATFRKLRKALKMGGTLVVNDFILNDDRTGHPFAMMFATQMLLMTKGGSTYRDVDYRTWLREAGFQDVELMPTGAPATLIFAS